MYKDNILDFTLNRNIGFIGLGQMGNALLLNFTNCLIQRTKNENLVKQRFYLSLRDQSKIEYYKKIGYKNVVSPENVLNF